MLDAALQKELIRKGRDFMKGYRDADPYEADFESDQDRKLPQPPLVKAARPGAVRYPLPTGFDALETKNDLAALIRDRHSSRVYTGQPIRLLQLSFLLWATQGVKEIRGSNYATLRTVPCGGARHEFETYLLVRQVEGLPAGAYHYLPMEHALEYFGPVSDPDRTLSDSLCEQAWAAKAGVVFYWSMAAYRAEWRYGIYAHRVALIDAGHVGQNLYLACTGLGLGTCAIAAVSHEHCNALFGLDGEEEFIFYAAPVGTVKASDKAAEQAFYADTLAREPGAAQP